MSTLQAQIDRWNALADAADKARAACEEADRLAVACGLRPRDIAYEMAGVVRWARLESKRLAAEQEKHCDCEGCVSRRDEAARQAREDGMVQAVEAALDGRVV